MEENQKKQTAGEKPEKKPDHKQIIKNLMDAAREKGVMTHDEIRSFFTDVPLTSDQFDKVVEMLEGMDVEIVD